MIIHIIQTKDSWHLESKLIIKTGSFKNQPKDSVIIMTDILKFPMTHRLEIF